MTDPMHQQLLGHLLGALDDDEQEWLAARLEEDEEYRRQWFSWRRRLSPLLAATPEFEPPPGLAERTCRLVAACAPMLAAEEKPRRAMSPDRALPGRAAGTRWIDTAVMASILLAIVALVPPAIHGSRFHSRLASCQDKLRQVGLALTQYGHHHQNALSELAADERLTGAGAFAAGVLGEDSSAAVFPVAWLAAQGVLNNPRCNAAVSPPQQFNLSELSGPLPPTPQSPIEPSDPAGLSPAVVAVLADDPGADLPGQSIDCHSGLGHNQFFEDGHVVFRPCLTPRDPAEAILSSGGSPASPGISAPITFVSRRY